VACLQLHPKDSDGASRPRVGSRQPVQRGGTGGIRLISFYAGLEARCLGANIRFVSVLPQLTPATALAKVYSELYAALAGMSEVKFLEGRFGGALSAEQVGESIAELAVDDSYTHPAYLVSTTRVQSVG
jgi:hypothetical protein